MLSQFWTDVFQCGRSQRSWVQLVCCKRAFSPSGRLVHPGQQRIVAVKSIDNCIELARKLANCTGTLVRYLARKTFSTTQYSAAFSCYAYRFACIKMSTVNTIIVKSPIGSCFVSIHVCEWTQLDVCSTKHHSTSRTAWPLQRLWNYDLMALYKSVYYYYYYYY